MCCEIEELFVIEVYLKIKFIFYLEVNKNIVYVVYCCDNKLIFVKESFLEFYLFCSILILK